MNRHYLINILSLCISVMIMSWGCSSSESGDIDSEAAYDSQTETNMIDTVDSSSAGSDDEGVLSTNNGGNEAGYAMDNEAGIAAGSDAGEVAGNYIECIYLVADDEQTLCLDNFTTACDYDLAELGFDCVDQDMDCYWVCDMIVLPPFIADPDDQRAYVQGPSFEEVLDEVSPEEPDVETDCRLNEDMESCIANAGIIPADIQGIDERNAVFTLHEFSSDYTVNTMQGCGQQQFVIIYQNEQEVYLLYLHFQDLGFSLHQQKLDPHFKRIERLQIECDAQMLYLIDVQQARIHYTLTDYEALEWSFNTLDVPYEETDEVIRLHDFFLNHDSSMTWIVETTNEHIVYYWKPRFMGGNLASEVRRTTDPLRSFRAESYTIGDQMATLVISHDQNQRLQYQVNHEEPVEIENVTQFTHNHQWLIWTDTESDELFNSVPWAISFYESQGLSGEVTPRFVDGLQEIQIMNTAPQFLLLKGLIGEESQWGVYSTDTWEFNLLDLNIADQKDVYFNQKFLLQPIKDIENNSLQILIHTLNL